MEKNIIVKLIEKYYLGGATEKVRWKVNDGRLKINFATELKDCIGELKCPIELPNTEIGVYDTTQLYKLINITNSPIEIDVIEKDGKAMKLDIKDNQFDLSYNLGDLGLISEGKINNAMPDPAITLNIDQEFISRFIKAHNALQKVETFIIKPEVDKLKVNNLKFTIGLKERYANKITFNQPTDTHNDIPTFTYNVNNFREILSNNKDADIRMSVFSMGIIKLHTIEDEIDVIYYIVPLSN